MTEADAQRLAQALRRRTQRQRRTIHLVGGLVLLTTLLGTALHERTREGPTHTAQARTQTEHTRTLDATEQRRLSDNLRDNLRDSLAIAALKPNETPPKEAPAPEPTPDESLAQGLYGENAEDQGRHLPHRSAHAKAAAEAAQHAMQSPAQER